MEVKGFCMLNSDADLNFAMDDESGNIFDTRSKEEVEKNLRDIWIGKALRCLEINEETKSVLVVSNDGQKMGMFDISDVNRYFHCGYMNGVVIPPNLDFFHQGAYCVKAQQRKGGYNRTVANMVIASSLAKGKFHDSFLWEKQ